MQSKRALKHREQVYAISIKWKRNGEMFSSIGVISTLKYIWHVYILNVMQTIANDYKN